MKNRIMLGRYIDTGSWVHQLDPRSKVTAMLLYMLVIFMIHSFTALGIVMIFSVFMMLSTRIPLAFFLRTLKPLFVIIVFIAIFHMLLDAGGARLFTLGPVNIYSGGIERGLLAASRMILFISFTAILTFTTTPNQLTQGLESTFAPLKLLRISPQKISLMISISLRFIPTIFEEAERILKAQASRGFALKEKKLSEKARTLISLLVPVTVSAFKRAGDLVDSMESRGYQLGMQRSKYEVLKWKWTDTQFILTFVILVILMLFIHFR